MRRDQQKFVVIKTTSANAPSAPKVETEKVKEVKREASPTFAERVFRFIEIPFVQTPISVVGGIIGLFMYGPVLMLCSVSVLAGIHRSGALGGLSLRARITTWITATILTVGGFFWVGVIIDRHRDPVLKPEKLAHEIIQGISDDLPKKAPPKIELGQAEPHGNPINGFQISVENTGDETATEEVETGGIYVRPLGISSEDEIFSIIADNQDRNTLKNGVLEPGHQHRTYADFPLTLTSKERDELNDPNSRSAAYIALQVSYYDSRGRQYAKDRCMIYKPGMPELGFCTTHNN